MSCITTGHCRYAFVKFGEKEKEQSLRRQKHTIDGRECTLKIPDSRYRGLARSGLGVALPPPQAGPCGEGGEQEGVRELPRRVADQG